MLSARKKCDSTEKRIEAIEKELRILKATKPRIVADDPYELLLMCDLFAMDKKILEALETTPFKIANRPVSDAMFKKLLDQFHGATVMEKKNNLKQFMHEHPALRTMNIELLLQRVYMWKNYHELFEQRSFPQNQIKEVLEQNPTPIEEPPAHEE